LNATPKLDGCNRIDSVNSRKTANNEPSEEELQRRENEQEQADKLKFTRMQKNKENSIREILKVQAKDRSSSQNFFLRMHLSMNVPFFANYNGQVLANVCNHLEQKVYDKGEIIIRKGDFGQELFVIMIGEAGVYVDEQLQ